MSAPPLDPRWRIRRRVVVLTLLYCAASVGYILLKGLDTETARTIVSSSFLLASTVIGCYIFGATWDDKGRAS